MHSITSPSATAISTIGPVTTQLVSGELPQQVTPASSNPGAPAPATEPSPGAMALNWLPALTVSCVVATENGRTPGASSRRPLKPNVPVPPTDSTLTVTVEKAESSKMHSAAP